MNQKYFCEICRRPFLGNEKDSLCNQCEEKLLEDILGFLEKHPEAEYEEVLEEMDATKQELDKWIQKGRLDLVSPALEKKKEKTLTFQQEIQEMQTKSAPEDKKEKGTTEKKSVAFHHQRHKFKK